MSRQRTAEAPGGRLPSGERLRDGALLSKYIENMYKANHRHAGAPVAQVFVLPDASRYPLLALPGLPGLAVGAGHGGRDRRQEHVAAFAAVGRPVHRATRVANTLDREVGWPGPGPGAGGGRGRGRVPGSRSRPAAAPSWMPPFAQAAGDAFAQGVGNACSHGSTHKDSVHARRFRSARTISWPNCHPAVRAGPSWKAGTRRAGV
jgi:hypothetical protein